MKLQAHEGQNRHDKYTYPQYRTRKYLVLVPVRKKFHIPSIIRGSSKISFNIPFHFYLFCFVLYCFVLFNFFEGKKNIHFL